MSDRAPQQEGGYEDSYQKRARLEKELEATKVECERFMKDVQAHLKAIDKFPSKRLAINVKLYELRTKEQKLSEELAAKEAENKNISKTSEQERARILLWIDHLRAKIELIREELSSLVEQYKKLTDDEIGEKGDTDASLAIAKMYVEKLSDIKRQLDELE